MKRFFLCLTAIAAAAALFAGCAAPAEPGGAEPYKIAVVQLVDNSAFTEMREGFAAKLAELGYGEGVTEIDVKDAQGDMSTLNSICAELKNSDYDLIVPIVTPATQAVVNAEVSAPVVFISVTNPVGAGIMSDMNTPDKNATGTSNIIPVDEIFNLAEQLTPGIKTIGILYCSSETNAVQTVALAKEYLGQNKYNFIESTVASSAEVQQAAVSLADRVDAIYVPIDSTVQSALDQVVEVATENRIPVYGSDAAMVRSGALACVAVSSYQLGEKSAEMAAQVLGGTPVSEIPAVAFDQFSYIVNSLTSDALEIVIPELENITIIGAAE